jgi:hypothetical protein
MLLRAPLRSCLSYCCCLPAAWLQQPPALLRPSTARYLTMAATGPTREERDRCVRPTVFGVWVGWMDGYYRIG